MKRMKLQFPGAEEAWNYIAAIRKPHLDVEDNTAEGFFTDDELELASERYGAQVQLAPIISQPELSTTVINEEGQPVELYGKSGRAYHGTIYTKAAPLFTLTSPALICLANSVWEGGTWHHHVNAIYATDDAAQEGERFRQRDDISHFIVVPAQEWSGTDATDDLIRSYLHG